MTISAAKSIPCPPPRRWMSSRTSLLVSRFAAMQPGQMVEVSGVSQSYIATTAPRYGFRVVTRKIGNGNVGVWLIK